MTLSRTAAALLVSVALLPVLAGPGAAAPSASAPPTASAPPAASGPPAASAPPTSSGRLTASGPLVGPDPPVVAVGAFAWPLPGVGGGPPAHGGETGAVARRFLAPPHPYGRGHRGADLVAPVGTAVLAAGDGTVSFAGAVGGRGSVSVEHADGLRTTYEPVDPAVTVGAVVVRGAVLGALVAGHRGCPAVACLHWGLRRPAPPGADHRLEYFDPLLLLGLGSVRLLPADDP